MKRSDKILKGVSKYTAVWSLIMLIAMLIISLPKDSGIHIWIDSLTENFSSFEQKMIPMFIFVFGFRATMVEFAKINMNLQDGIQNEQPPEKFFWEKFIHLKMQKISKQITDKIGKEQIVNMKKAIQSFLKLYTLYWILFSASFIIVEHLFGIIEKFSLPETKLIIIYRFSAVLWFFIAHYVLLKFIESDEKENLKIERCEVNNG